MGLNTDTENGPLSSEGGQSAGAGRLVSRLSPGSWEQEKHQIQGALSSPGTTTWLFSLLFIWRAFLILKVSVRQSFREKTSLNLMENHLSFSVRKRERDDRAAAWCL